MLLRNATILQLLFKEFFKIFLFQNILSHQILFKNMGFFYNYMRLIVPSYLCISSSQEFLFSYSQHYRGKFGNSS